MTDVRFGSEAVINSEMYSGAPVLLPLEADRANCHSITSWCPCSICMAVHIPGRSTARKLSSLWSRQKTVFFCPLCCLTSEATELKPGTGPPRTVCQLPDVANWKKHIWSDTARSREGLLRMQSSGAPLSFICHREVGGVPLERGIFIRLPQKGIRKRRQMK